jgi:cell wall-associated NlpC family hydrolase
MLKLNLLSRLVRKSIVPVILTLTIGLPLLCQPLGLFSAWNQPADSQKAAVAETSETTGAFYFEPVDYNELDSIFGRSLDENTVDINEPAPDILDNEVEYTDTVDPSGMGGLMPTPTESPFRTVDYMLYISANELNLRAAPALDSIILSVLKFGDKVQCTGENNAWMMVTANGKTGYLKTEYTSQDMVFKSVKQTVYVDASKLNLRKEPTTDSSIILTLASMTRLTRTGIGDGWSEVKTASGKVGYVASKYLTTRGPSTSTPNTSGSGTTYDGDIGRVVDLAYSTLGVRYVHAGSSMSGFDCSGLVSWVYRQIGISVPRSTSGYYSIGVGVSYGNMRAGDIICMDTRRSDGKTSITHVGIYVGGGMMIHASSTKGRVVLQNVSQYLGWGVKLITIRRMIS